MASRTAKISPSIVSAMGPDEIVWDSELSRFGVRSRRGCKSYFVKVRIDRRQRWLNIGRHGPMTAAEARAAARLALADVDRGEDPTRERDRARATPLFAEFAAKWLKEHVTIKRKPNTAREYVRIVERNLNPALGKVRLDRLDRSDALSIHTGLALQPYVANRAIAVLSAIMTFAEKLGHRPAFSNPCRGIERFKEHKRKRPLTKAELASLWAHLLQIEHEANPFIVGSIRLLILTGMRREEVLGLQWAHVDFNAGMLRLPDTKTGARDIILSRHAVEMIKALPRVEANPYVFAGMKDGQRLVNISKAWSEIRGTLGFPDVRIHDLRHTVASLLARSAPLVVVRDALGHSEISTTNGYSHAANEDVRAAVNDLAIAITGSAR